jgi:hypothetical protein
MAVLVVGLTGCDTLIADRWVIRTTADHSSVPGSTSQVLATAHLALGDCGLVDGDSKVIGDTLLYRDPQKPPGLHVTVYPADEGFRVTLAQDLYGPIGPTDAYRCVREALRVRLQMQYGQKSVRLE